MSGIIQWIEEVAGINYRVQEKILYSIIAIAVIYLLNYFLNSLIKKTSDDLKSVYMWNKTLSYFRMFFLVIVLLRIWFEGVGELGTYLGLLSAGVAIALKDPLANFAGWIFILWRRPFELGDRVEIGQNKGDVIDIRIFQFTLMEIGNWVDADQSTGRIIHIPNGTLFTTALANYNKGFEMIWNEIGVLLTFESNWSKAKNILQNILDEVNQGKEKTAMEKIRNSAKKFMIYYRNLTPIVYTKVLDSGVNLSLRYLCEPRKRRGAENDIWERILTEFAKHKDIDFAYPTTRFYDNRTEGKKKDVSSLEDKS